MIQHRHAVFLRLTTLPEDGSGSQPKRVSSGSIGCISGGLGFSMGLWSRGQFSSQRNMWNAMVKQVNIARSDAKKMHLENFDPKGSLKKPYCRWKNYMTSRGDVEQKKKKPSTAKPPSGFSRFDLLRSWLFKTLQNFPCTHFVLREINMVSVEWPSDQTACVYNECK